MPGGSSTRLAQVHKAEEDECPYRTEQANDQAPAQTLPILS